MRITEVIPAMIQKEKQAQLGRIATLNSAKAEELAAKAELQHLRARKLDTQQMTASSATKQRLSGELDAINTRLAASEARVAAATNATAAATARTTVAARGLTAIRGALSGVVNMLGGPYMLALTAATTGVYYLSQRESAGEYVSRKYAESLRKVNEELWGAKEGAEEAADSVDNKTASQLKVLLEETESKLEELERDFIGRLATRHGYVDDAALEKAHELIRLFGGMTISADEFIKKSEELSTSIGRDLDPKFQDLTSTYVVLKREHKEISLQPLINEFKALGRAAYLSGEGVKSALHGMSRLSGFTRILAAGKLDKDGNLKSTSTDTTDLDPPVDLSGISKVDKKAQALERYEDMLKKLTLTEKEYEKYQNEKELASFEKEGLSVEQIDALRQAG